MKKILGQKNFIKDYGIISIILFLIFTFILSLIIPLKSSSSLSVLIGIEQALFLILSAILFVFHDSIIGFKSISKLRDEIEKLKEDEIKNIILEDISLKDQSVNYDEFLSTIDNDMLDYTKIFQNFKRKSYKLYAIFSTFGLLAIILSLIKNGRALNWIINNLTLESSISCGIIYRSFIIDYCIYSQILFILLFIYSSFQAEKQKIALFNFLAPQNIKNNINTYIEEKDNKRLSDALQTMN